MGKDYTDDMITSSANQQMKHLSQLVKSTEKRLDDMRQMVEEKLQKTLN